MWVYKDHDDPLFMIFFFGLGSWLFQGSWLMWIFLALTLIGIINLIIIIVDFIKSIIHAIK